MVKGFYSFAPSVTLRGDKGLVFYQLWTDGSLFDSAYFAQI